MNNLRILRATRGAVVGAFPVEQITGIDTTTLLKVSRVELANSALHAPAAGFGDDDFYPDVHDKAATLICRLTWNPPPPTATSAPPGRPMFVDLDGGHWTPDTDEAVTAPRAL